ncbi:hypothetical protein [Polyangium sp. 6x1]|uniref:hypothetical protein n=1 Tax=Polyangium sp. 6x1 TaxID=3042689 RepID=UPI002482FA47|nr:hypothetical protein [Polyangium sp. 6x1]MDI1450820.1 hypothetical protein [Polyangium sp. 6x1]
MTLLERTQSLAARAKQRREQEKREEVAKKVRARTRNLEHLLEQLDAARERAASLDGAGHARTSWPAPPISAFDAYDPKGGTSITIEADRQNEWEKFVLLLGKFVKKADEAVAQDVKQAKQNALEGISPEDLRSYLDDPSTERLAQDLLKSLESLRARRWEALSGAELGAALHEAATLRENVVRLRETGASEELLKFLALARKDGAHVDALTNTLRAELASRKLIDRLRLVLR